MKDLYQTNKDFKDYVDKYSRQYVEGKSITLEEALEHSLVREYGKVCMEGSYE